jgi:thiamine biosynthesis protein ThiI
MSHTIVVRFAEITLKGRNRGMFEQQLISNLRKHLQPQVPHRLERGSARALVTTEDDPRQAVEILRGLPGVANLSVAELVPREPEALSEAVLRHVGERLAHDLPRGNGPPAPARPLPFRIEVSRKDKRYPLTSPQLAARLGEAVLRRYEGLRVDLTAPELTVWVEIWDRQAAIYADKIQGPGGLPVGSSGKVLCLMSGGIDSPVAAYLLMTRGAEVTYLYFHSFPFIGEQSKEKVHELVRHLARYQPRSRLFVAPFAKAQEAIRDHCPEGARTVLYRRMMNRVANRVAERERALALVTGESLGQVASQTLPNIRAIQETAALPVLQPLIGLSKTDIIDIARRIGTYPISIQPFPDCCTLFQPKHPDTRTRPERLGEYEKRLPVEALVEECIAGLETAEYGPLWAPAGWV